ncbi:MAG TPA: hypothetical protein VNA69_05805 [Thermoanaerobaculia bacterium]|nr:hypothetical protein [Thermoanaerobaculia bacterium]
MILISRLLAAALVVLLATPALSQEIIYATPLSPVTLSELEGVASAAPQRRRAIHHEEKSPLSMLLGRRPDSVTLIPTAVPTLVPPPLTVNFSVVGSGFLAPADAAGAVGKDHLVAATNGGVAVHTKTGQHLTTISLDVFMRDVVVDTTDYYDPRVVYDRASDRWVMMCIRAEEHVMLGVSRTGDPRGTWDRYRITLPQAWSYVDFLHLALTRDTVVFETRHLGGSIVVSISKSDLYQAARPLPMRTYGYGEVDVTPVTNEESGVEYVLDNLGGDSIDVTRLDSSQGRLIRLPIGSAFFDFQAPQTGSTNRLSTGFTYHIETATMRNGAIYAVQTFGRSNASRAAIAWWKLDPEAGVLLDSGLIEDPTATMHYSYPSLDVNRAGAMVIGFATFSASQFPSSGYVYRDALGRESTIGTIRMGEGPFTWVDRWGDYTTTLVDPFDDTAFWTLQIYATRDRWITTWSKVQTKTIPTRRRGVRH